MTEKTRMTATDAINSKWKDDAVAAFNALDAKYTGEGKQAKIYEGLLATTNAKKAAWDPLEQAYKDHIAKAEYTTPAAKAKVAEDSSDIAEQKAVVTARGLATAANTKVKDAIKAEAAKRKELDDEIVACGLLEVKVQEALTTCEAKRYTDFRT